MFNLGGLVELLRFICSYNSSNILKNMCIIIYLESSYNRVFKNFNFYGSMLSRLV